MSNTVFILGAGASKQAGAPLMKDFLDTAHVLWKTGKVGESEHSFKLVFDAVAALQPVHSKSQLDLNNIESIFTTCEIAKTLGRFPGKSDNEIDDLIGALKVVIVRTLELTVQFPCPNGSYIAGPKPYAELAYLIDQLQKKATPKHSVSVLTFNYDIAVDVALHVAGFVCQYGLDAVRPPAHPHIVPLLKLHGSLNWTVTREGIEPRQIVPWPMAEFLTHYQVTGLVRDGHATIPISLHFNQFVNQQVGRVTGQPVIVPPAWNKADNHRALSPVWRRAALELSEAENVFVCGFSLPETDGFFKYLYALGAVGQVPFKRFWVFDPDGTGTVQGRFEALLGPGAEARFQYFQKNFREAIGVLRTEFPG